MTRIQTALATLLLLLFCHTSNAAIVPEFINQMSALEAKTGGRIGVVALNTANNISLEYRAHERFSMCSTFKFLLVAAVLAKVDHNQEDLNRTIKYSSKDMVSHAPITEKNLTKGEMTVRELCIAVSQYSDNPATNLLLKSLGGPEALNKFIRSLGDHVTRIDRYEPEMISNILGDERDTTTPLAMLEDLNQVILGSVLSDKSKALLTEWMLHNTTGGFKIRAGLDQTWKIADRTGAGHNGASSAIAVVWPPNKTPFILTIYASESKRNSDELSKVIAEVATIASNTLYH